MVVLIGINGFGRIGRQVFRATLSNPDVKVVAINDPVMDAEFASNCIKYDSALGRYHGTVEVKSKSTVCVDGGNLEVFSHSDPMQIPWGDVQAQYVIECSGVFTTIERAASHLAGGAQRVIVCAPSADAPTIVHGVNEASFKPSYQVVSAGSCTAVALGPILQLLEDRIGFDECLFTAIHAATGQQRPVDGTASKDPRLARGSEGNLIPCATTALKTLQRIMPPAVINRVNGSAVRVPTSAVSLLDVTVRFRAPVTKSEVDEVFRRAAQHTDDGRQSIAGFTVDPVVGVDFSGPCYQSFVYDANASIMLQSETSVSPSPVSPSRHDSNNSTPVDRVKGQLFKLMFWYNNESGYAHRVLDTVLGTSTQW